MLPIGTLLSFTAKAICLLTIILLTSNLQYTRGNTHLTNEQPNASSEGGRVAARLHGRARLSLQRRQLLETKLRTITGLPEVKFDEVGVLRLNADKPLGGSRTARELLEKAVHDDSSITIEDTSRHPEVIFARVAVVSMPKSTESRVYLIQIDFADFESLMGDEPALRAFDVGWALLHELHHVVEGSKDARLSKEVGDCEAHINLMREECNLPLRAAYFHTSLPRGATQIEYTSRFVRLPFVQRTANKQKRYWVMWDAALVGGLSGHKTDLGLTSSAIP